MNTYRVLVKWMTIKPNRDEHSIRPVLDEARLFRTIEAQTSLAAEVAAINLVKMEDPQALDWSFQTFCSSGSYPMWEEDYDETGRRK